VDLQYNSVIFN